MKILIVADSHGDTYGIREAYLRHYQAEVFLHAGDVCDYPANIHPFLACRGNCDGMFRNDYAKEVKIDTPYGKLLMRHHPFREEEIDALKNEGYRILVHGHTHVREDKEIRGVRILCPGSISYPRDGMRGYLLLEAEKDSLKATFHDL